MNFEFAIRAEFATQYLMHETGQMEMPVELMLPLGYDLAVKDREKWDAIQQIYKTEIDGCLKNGCGNREGFKYKALDNQTHKESE